ncbi:MAG: energy-coupling factor ABC transporter permease, partial [Oscillospiraceae bacterium]|nr:energy-coupling factor ABC transporter permease [Oscillospiraceae bacterium]
MHMADALLAPAVAATMYVASGTAAGISIHKLKQDDEPQKLPVMAVTAALVFAGQMINYTIPGTGSSGHMCGGMLLSALLGPQAGFLSMIVILAIQCLFFADGGLMALGANIWNMAFYGCFVGYYLIWRPIMRSNWFGEGKSAQRARIIAASIIGCIVTLQLGAFSVVLETSLSGITELPFGAFCALMQPIHLAIGLVEGLITSAVLLFVYESRPELLQCVNPAEGEGSKRSLKAVVAILAVVALVVGGGLSLL